MVVVCLWCCDIEPAWTEVWMNSTQVIDNMVVVYLWCSDIEPAWAEVWVNSTQVYLWCSDIEPAWTEVWMHSTRHLVPADAPLAHDGVGVVVPPGAHVSHHAGTFCRESAAVIYTHFLLTLILMAFFPAKVQDLANIKNH